MERLTTRLSEGERAAWRAKVWEMLRVQTERYTMGQSTSLREETARALLQSICFLLEQLHQAQPERQLLMQPPEALLREGSEVVRRQTARTRLRYEQACRCLYQEESISLRGTVIGIRAFFRAYDPYFFPAEIPCDIDYQLSLPVPEALLGVAWLRAYLDRLLTEDAILRRFAPETVRRVLANASPTHRELLVNLYEPVAAAALGATVAEGDLFTLDFSYEELAKRLASPLTRIETLERAGEKLAHRLGLPSGAVSYLRETARALAPRVEVVTRSGQWQGVFPRGVS